MVRLLPSFVTGIACNVLGPDQFRGFPKPTPAKMKPCGFVRSTPAGFLADVLVSSVETLSGVSAFVTLAQQRSEKITLYVFHVSLYFYLQIIHHTCILSVMAIAQDTSAPKSNHKKNARWSQEDNAVLIEQLKIHQSKGHQSDSGWKSLVWTACEVALRESEIKSGGGPKTASGCKEHWLSVCLSPCDYYIFKTDV